MGAVEQVRGFSGTDMLITQKRSENGAGEVNTETEGVVNEEGGKGMCSKKYLTV